MSAHINRSKHRYLLQAIAAIAIVGCTQAQAAQDEMQVRNVRETHRDSLPVRRTGAESRSVTVAYGDLDLAGSAGARTLYSRLVTAARTVCSPAPGRDLAAHRDWNSCYTDALDTAVAQTGVPAVAAIHDEQTGRGTIRRVASSN